LVVTLVGLGCIAIAGKRREEILERQNMDSLEYSSKRLSVQDGPVKQHFKTGLVLCIASGIVSPMLNLSLAFGQHIADNAGKHGTKNYNKNNAVFALGVGCGGFVVNVGYSIFLMLSNGTVTNLCSPNIKKLPLYWMLGVLMGALWIGGFVLYGIGVALIGSLGAVIGWPLVMIANIMASQFWGLMAGDWKGITSWKPKFFMIIGILILFGAAGIISTAGSLKS